MMELFTTENLIALVTLTAMEVVLGIDNVVFIAILCGKLPEHMRARARRIGLGLALVMRVLLLLGISWVVGLKAEVFKAFGHAFTWKDLVLLAGGLFLIWKSVKEIHHKVEGGDGSGVGAKAMSFSAAISQIVVLDLVFSLDSVITAVGMAESVLVMIVAVMIAVGVMLAFAGRISRFVERHPTVKMLALSFLLLIGVMLVADGCGRHIEKGYIYFAMAFALGVEVLNLASKRKGGVDAGKADPAATGAGAGASGSTARE